MNTTQGDDYCFVVKDPEERSVALEMREHDDLAKQNYLTVWQKLSLALQKHHQLGKTTDPPEWTTWKPGEWCDQKHGYEKRQKYVAWCGNNLVGFLHVWPDFPSAHQLDQSVLYIEHLAAAPGNLDTELWARRFRYVGAALLAYAVLLGKSQGFGGRVGLHAADEKALEFYRYLHEAKCGGKLFSAERADVPGPTPRGDQDRTKTYLEMSEEGANAWLGGYRRG